MYNAPASDAFIVDGENFALRIETASHGDCNESPDTEVASVSHTKAVLRPLDTAGAVAVNAH